MILLNSLLAKVVYRVLKKGFSLLELSIVLAVISLLLIVTITAHKLLLSAQINHVVSSSSKLISSVGVFISAYEKFPGDFDEASSYWPDVSLSDGDGDGKIEMELYESTNALIHMAAAEVLKSQAWDEADLYQPYIMDSFNNGGAVIISNIDNSGDDRSGFAYVSDNGNYIKFGSGEQYDDEVFTPKQQYLIDIKIDNGNAHTGQLVMKISNLASDDCSDDDGIYNTAVETESCLFLLFIDTLASES